MSILKTKPRWAPSAVATDRGWQDPVTGEVYVAVGNLLKLIAAETEAKEVIPEQKEVVIVQESVIQPTENKEIMNSTEAPKVTEERVKRTYNKKSKAEVNEQVEQPANVQILGEVVEYSADLKVIGE